MSGAPQEEDKKPADQIHINLKVKGQSAFIRQNGFIEKSKKNNLDDG